MCVCMQKKQSIIRYLLYIQFKCLKDDIFIRSCLISTQSHFNVVTSACWQLLHEPWRVVERTASVESTTALAIPERIIGVKAIFKMLRTSCIAKVVTANKRGDWYGLLVVDICTRTYCVWKCQDLIKCSSKCPYVFPGIASVR